MPFFYKLNGSGLTAPDAPLGDTGEDAAGVRSFIAAIFEMVSISEGVNPETG